MVALAAAVPLVVGLEVSLPVAFSWAWVLWALPAALPSVLWQLPLPLWASAGQCASPGDVALPLEAHTSPWAPTSGHGHSGTAKPALRAGTLPHWGLQSMAPGITFHLLPAIACTWDYHCAAAKPEGLWPTMRLTHDNPTHIASNGHATNTYVQCHFQWPTTPWKFSQQVQCPLANAQHKHAQHNSCS